MEQAVQPGVLPTYHQLRKLPKREPSQDEKALAILADTGGWQALKEYIESLIGHIQALQGVDESSTVEQVGFKYLAANVSCYYLQAVINRVEEIKKFFEEEEEKKKNALRKRRKER